MLLFLTTTVTKTDYTGGFSLCICTDALDGIYVIFVLWGEDDSFTF